MKVITKEQIESRFTVQDVSFLENMDEDTLTSYLQLYSYLQILLNVYVSEYLGLERYDAYLEYSELKYKKVKEEDMDVYQYLGSSVMQYFYIRNNLFLERLTKEERDFFVEKMVEENYKVDEKMKDYIKNILSRVIVETEKTRGEVGLTNFGPDIPSYFAPMNALLIGLRYDEFYHENMTDEEWDFSHEQQQKDLDKLISQLNLELESKLDIPFKVIQYNEFSVKKFR